MVRISIRNNFGIRKENNKKSIPSLILTIVFICLTSFVPYLRNYYKKIFEIAIPNQSWISVDQFNLTRLDIWQSALQNILKNPIFGSGSGSFPEIFLNETGVFSKDILIILFWN